MAMLIDTPLRRITKSVSGDRTDKLGRHYRFVNGHRVAIDHASPPGKGPRRGSGAAVATPPQTPRRAALDKLAAIGQRAGKLEHSAKEWITKQVAKLPGALSKPVKIVYHAAFASYTAAQAAVKAVAKERGLSPEHVDRVAKCCAAADVVGGGKLFPMALTAVGAGGLAAAGSFVPVGSLAYLGYSTARDPMATYRAAKGGVKTALKKLGIKKGMGSKELIAALCERKPSEEWLAAFCVALDEVKGDAAKAIEVADEVAKMQTKALCTPFRRYITKSFNEADHPRGQPENAGQFGSGGGGGGDKPSGEGKPDKPKEDKPADSPKEESDDPAQAIIDHLDDHVAAIKGPEDAEKLNTVLADAEDPRWVIHDGTGWATIEDLDEDGCGADIAEQITNLGTEWKLNWASVIAANQYLGDDVGTDYRLSLNEDGKIDLKFSDGYAQELAEGHEQIVEHLAASSDPAKDAEAINGILREDSATGRFAANADGDYVYFSDLDDPHTLKDSIGPGEVDTANALLEDYGSDERLYRDGADKVHVLYESDRKVLAKIGEPSDPAAIIKANRKLDAADANVAIAINSTGRPTLVDRAEYEDHVKAMLEGGFSVDDAKQAKAVNDELVDRDIPGAMVHDGEKYSYRDDCSGDLADAISKLQRSGKTDWQSIEKANGKLAEDGQDRAISPFPGEDGKLETFESGDFSLTGLDENSVNALPEKERADVVVMLNDMIDDHGASTDYMGFIGEWQIVPGADREWVEKLTEMNQGGDLSAAEFAAINEEYGGAFAIEANDDGTSFFVIADEPKVETPPPQKSLSMHKSLPTPFRVTKRLQ